MNRELIRATTFEVDVSVDERHLYSKLVWAKHRAEILASFAASLDHWIAEQRLELRDAD